MEVTPQQQGLLTSKRGKTLSYFMSFLLGIVQQVIVDMEHTHPPALG
jgi:hypothetical protein